MSKVDLAALADMVAAPFLTQRNIASGFQSLSKMEANWRTWLPMVGPRTFTGAFSLFHAQLWDWYWLIMQKRRLGLPLSNIELAFLAIWFRGGGKSSNVEWCCGAEGALVGEGYVLYVSGTQDLANGHVMSIRERLESEEVSTYYPKLAKPKIGRHGNQYGWRQDFLITDGGWAVRPVGLDVGIRGGKQFELRPTLIIFDDIDATGDSPAVVQKKLDTITRAILPAGTKNTAVLVAQNLIHRNSVVNQIHTRRSSALAKRITSGPHVAFRDLKIELQDTEHGRRNIIVAGTPTWSDIDLEACQKFLDDSGLEAFMAEYQHDFTASEQGRVIPEYDEAVHVITWSQFEAKFGVRYIPELWGKEVGHDVGFTKEHLSAWTWLATSAANSALPGKRFRYRGLTFVDPQVDDMAEEVKRTMEPDLSVGRDYDEAKKIFRWTMSHEAKSERNTYFTKHGLPFYACDSGKTAGISQWRHYLRVDKKQPHPFHEDTQFEDGTWALGSPAWFDVVDDDQRYAPRNDRGLKTHREQVVAWNWRPTPLTDSGMVKAEPVKAFEDCNDSTRMITAEWGPEPTPLNAAERVQAALPDHLKTERILKDIEAGTRDPNGAWMAQQQMVEQIKKRQQPKSASGWMQYMDEGRGR